MPQLSISNSPASPALSTTLWNTASAEGLRQILPRHTNSTLVLPAGSASGGTERPGVSIAGSQGLRGFAEAARHCTKSQEGRCPRAGDGQHGAARAGGRWAVHTRGCKGKKAPSPRRQMRCFGMWELSSQNRWLPTRATLLARHGADPHAPPQLQPFPLRPLLHRLTCCCTAAT